MMDKSDIIMTKDSNAAAMAVMYANGLCASPHYMTKREAEAVRSLPSSMFSENEDLTKLDELRFFTNIQQIPWNFLNATKNLSYAVFPEGVTSLGYTAAILRSATSGMRFIFPSTFTEFENLSFRSLNGRATNPIVIIFLSVTPPTAQNIQAFHPDGAAYIDIYVPDASLSAYQSSPTFQTQYQNRMKPLSECPASVFEFHDLLGGRLTI